jgi:CDGSH-type Zn-finger protein
MSSCAAITRVSSTSVTEKYQTFFEMGCIVDEEFNVKNVSSAEERQEKEKSGCLTGLLPLLLNSNHMAATKLIINNNGSVKVEGDFEIVDKDGNAYGLQGRTVISLCRCGRSANKPFCDGSHKEHFEHEAKAFDLPPKKV